MNGFPGTTLVSIALGIALTVWAVRRNLKWSAAFMAASALASLATLLLKPYVAAPTLSGMRFAVWVVQALILFKSFPELWAARAAALQAKRSGQPRP